MSKLFPPNHLFKHKATELEYVREEFTEIESIIDNLPNLNEILTKISNAVHSDKTSRGMPALQVLKIMLLRKYNNYSYRELAMATKDSISVIKFLQLGANESFSKDTLNRDINKVPAEVWEELNNSIIKYAKNKKIESGEKIRTDCFSTETNIHFPTDSNLIADVVRVLSRNMKVIQKILTTQLTINIPDRTKTTKSKLFNFNNTKKSKVKRKLQLELIRIVKEVLENTGELLQFINTKQGAFEFNNIIHGLKFNAAVANLITFHKLGLIVYNQAYQRNLKNAKLPASEKIVSIFEPHTDIIAKGNREVVFGHKICITTGESGLILNLKVLSGNPNDASILQEQLKTT
jgi:IS5 family transposase